MVYYIDIALPSAVVSRFSGDAFQKIRHHLELTVSVGMTHKLRIPIVLNIVKPDTDTDCDVFRVIKTNLPSSIAHRAGFRDVQAMAAGAIFACLEGVDGKLKERNA